MILSVFEEERKGERQQNANTESTETFARLEGPTKPALPFTESDGGEGGGGGLGASGHLQEENEKKTSREKKVRIRLSLS